MEAGNAGVNMLHVDAVTTGRDTNDPAGFRRRGTSRRPGCGNTMIRGIGPAGTEGLDASEPSPAAVTRHSGGLKVASLAGLQRVFRL